MKYSNLFIYLFLFIGLVSSKIQAQTTFSDDFESYTTGSQLAKSSSKWTTWSGTEGNNTDPQIVSTEAHSGKNSVMISSTATKGGPIDLILPFGQVYDLGTFNYEIWYKIPAMKASYFNFQGQIATGKEWTISAEFKSDTSLVFSDPLGNVLLTTTYPQGRGFKFELKIDLNSAYWQVLVDGKNHGSFNATIFSIASINYYPSDDKNQWWMDDVAYTYTPSSTNFDVALTNIKVDGNKLTGAMDTVKTTIRNAGKTTITSVEINMEYNSNNKNETFSGLNIQTGEAKTLSFTNQISLVGGIQTIKANVLKINTQNTDDNTNNNSITSQTKGITPAKNRVIITEEKTGTWCGWCVRGHVFLNYMNMNYEKYFGGIAIHNADLMVLQDYDSFASKQGSDWSGGFPNLIFNRKELFDPSRIEDSFLEDIVKPSIVTMTNGASWDATSRTLKVSVKSVFSSDISGNWSLACALTEDSVHNNNYNQANYYSGGGSGVMGGYELLANPVVGSKMYYNDVARAILPNPWTRWNSKGILPTTIKNGDEIILNFEFHIPSSWNEKKLNLISFVTKPDKSIENGGKASFVDALTNGFLNGTVGINHENNVSQNNVELFPNPANDLINLNFTQTQPSPINLNILSIDGKLIKNQEYKVSSAQMIQMQLDISTIPNGIYLLETNIGGQKIMRKFIKE